MAINTETCCREATPTGKFDSNYQHDNIYNYDDDVYDDDTRQYTGPYT